MSGDRIPPGYYTPETLPPLSEGARKILASVDAGVALERNGGGGLHLGDSPFAPLSVSNLPISGFTPDR